MINISVLVVWLKTVLLTEYAAAAAMAFVISGGFYYAASLSGVGVPTGSVAVEHKLPDMKIGVYRPFAPTRPVDFSEENSAHYCVTPDFEKCATTGPEVGSIVRWCLTEDNLSCQRSGANRR
ncbi:conserved protein of unknown function [Rhodovastum atsumiense]|uniref:Uncharacterized protein n=1 Tax=Rhodovastum atsumiense TaxID=504468 RepID=A0A5M6IR68_9PROT|nr:hypothetical protein [Rhodovastum atsumiense]KAA5610784.1 hypothetical protein F1189_17830 [Rhodovastum atsumiense]CAH2604454.1 conserved protein of unknown function [Rhodovastum atsumiense]